MTYCTSSYRVLSAVQLFDASVFQTILSPFRLVDGRSWLNAHARRDNAPTDSLAHERN